MKKHIRLFPLAVVLLSSALSSCGGVSNPNKYSVWLYSGVDSQFYSDYMQNPALQYLLKDKWGDSNIDFDFWIPAAGSAQNNYDTIVGSGDYPVMMQNSVSDSAIVMYQNGMILDLTSYVKDYMPNYYALIQQSTPLKNATTFKIDGEEKILTLTTLNEAIPYYYTGPVYRRDWVAKYGTNPTTGAAFTYGYSDANDVDSWVDDVVFPSGNSDPVYISDWEWMFKIFEKAQQALNITDGYCISEFYQGYTWGIGGLNSSFGEGNPVWYQSTAEGRPVKFGGVEDSMRSYFECLNTWYKNKWLDQNFSTRTRDSFYSIDTTNVRLGKIGMWVGLKSDLGGRLDLHDGGNTAGINVAGAAWPINDVYGPESCKKVVPNGIATDSLTGSGFFLMKGAEKYNLKSLLTFIDYLYTKEGGALRTLGLSKTQLDEMEDTSFYDNHNLSEGAYTIGSDGRYVEAAALKKDAGGLSTAVSLSKFPGYELVSSIDHGYAATYEESLKKWIKYGNSILIWGSNAQANMSASDYDTAQSALNRVLDYMTRNAYKFITGASDPYADSAWNSWCSALSRFNYDKITALLQPYCDANPIG